VLDKMVERADIVEPARPELGDTVHQLLLKYGYLVGQALFVDRIERNIFAEEVLRKDQLLAAPVATLPL
jgi:hypothetical protein